MQKDKEKIGELNDENARLILALAKTVEQMHRVSTLKKEVAVGDDSEDTITPDMEVFAPKARKSSNVVCI
jgi:hypothetical protein